MQALILILLVLFKDKKNVMANVVDLIWKCLQVGYKQWYIIILLFNRCSICVMSTPYLSSLNGASNVYLFITQGMKTCDLFINSSSQALRTNNHKPTDVHTLIFITLKHSTTLNIIITNSSFVLDDDSAIFVYEYSWHWTGIVFIR